MIYDCFSFFNELDMLEIRLNVLNNVVDKFVLVEATKTHSGKDKPLYFQENKERFKEFEHKIIHLIVDQYPEYKSAWSYENHQRNYMANALKNCNDEDVLIVSDLDEIPNPEMILKYKDTSGLKAFKQNFFYYFLNNLSNESWTAAKMLSYKDFKNILDAEEIDAEPFIKELNNGTTLTKVRQYGGPKNIIIENGGWHFSYLADFETIAYKIKSFGHQEFNSDKYTDIENIKKRINTGIDLFERPNYKFLKIKITNKDYPEYIVKNQKKLSKYILPNAKFSLKGTIKFNKFIAKALCMFLPSKYLRREIRNKFSWV